jgi:hypothetical protein
MSQKNVFKTLKMLLLRFFIMLMIFKIFGVLVSYSMTYVMDMVNDRLKYLDPEDKIGNEGLIN